MKKSRFDFSLNVKIYKKQDKRCDFRKDYHLIKKNDYLCRTLGRNMTEGLAVLIIANVANAMKTIKAVTANKGKC